ncbi:UMP kinase [Candidatus Woesearchaeota archaeon]|nr:UMP kinase [Candidatus Woesearchaeota archaeon]
MHKMKTIVISVGGSIIVPDKVDVAFIKNFKKLVGRFAKKGYRFGIYCGGGKLARDYQKAASSVSKLGQKELDWLGIHATWLNADLLVKIFGNLTDGCFIIDPTKKVKSKKKVLVAGGWKPGWSTDYDAVLLARNLKARIVINMTNVDYVYNKDPKKNKGAKPIKETTWKELRKLVGSKWKAGLNMPFDPIASKKAEQLGLSVAIIGKNLKNLEKLLNNKPFKGTIIR